MAHDDWEARLGAVIEAHGLTRCEFEAFVCPGYRIPAKLSVIAEWTRSECDGGPNFTVTEYRDAIDRLIRRGYLCVLTDHGVADEADRCRTFPGRAMTDEGYCAGCVDFTQRGFDMSRDILREMAGQAAVDDDDVWVRHVEAERSVEIIGSTVEACQRRVARVMGDQTGLAGVDLRREVMFKRPVAIVDISEPTLCGPWSPVRFVEHNRGFIVTIRYEQLKRVIVYDRTLGLRVWFDWHDPPSAVGKLRGHSVMFDSGTRSVHYQVADKPIRLYGWTFTVRPEKSLAVAPIFTREASNLESPPTLAQAEVLIRACAAEYIASRMPDR